MISIIQAICANRPSPQNPPHWQLQQVSQQSDVISFVLFLLKNVLGFPDLNVIKAFAGTWDGGWGIGVGGLLVYKGFQRLGGAV